MLPWSLAVLLCTVIILNINFRTTSKMDGKFFEYQSDISMSPKCDNVKYFWRHKYLAEWAELSKIPF